MWALHSKADPAAQSSQPRSEEVSERACIAASAREAQLNKKNLKILGYTPTILAVTPYLL